ncbi:hypothetical protein DM02DRAFT_413770 [Periconia macrospinosa]|uniref:Uncharacterized protein n=1 Tax=Periconia macrospinosa TaxID=97972 RepID=A0A2V1DRC1_9PLEO|nr:hypothetical protein DM02DRAFT_413770 [Periconia macrospinosa]
MPQSFNSEVLAQVETLAAASEELLADGELRAKLYVALGAARSSIETPTDLVTRILETQVNSSLIIQLNFLHGYYQTAEQIVESSLINVALDLELFVRLQDGDKSPKSLSHLSQSTGADPSLLSMSTYLTMSP